MQSMERAIKMLRSVVRELGRTLLQQVVPLLLERLERLGRYSIFSGLFVVDRT